MGIMVISRWATEIEDRDVSGIAVFRFGDSALKDFESLRVKSTAFLKDILTRDEDAPFISPVVSLFRAHTDYSASYYRTGEFTFLSDLQSNYPELSKVWDDYQFIVLQDTDPLVDTLQELVEQHCILMETDKESVHFMPVTPHGFQMIALDAMDHYVYGNISPDFCFTADGCKRWNIPYLFTTN
jgi:hypothetical protein